MDDEITSPDRITVSHPIKGLRNDPCVTCRKPVERPQRFPQCIKCWGVGTYRNDPCLTCGTPTIREKVFGNCILCNIYLKMETEVAKLKAAVSPEELAAVVDDCIARMRST
jgi:hypothetical protein